MKLNDHNESRAVSNTHGVPALEGVPFDPFTGFEMYYQPQIDRQRRLVSVEALLRWGSLDQPWSSPGELIADLERTREIIPLGWWILRTISIQMQIWSQCDELAGVAMSVNVSPVQLQERGFVDKFLTMLDRYRIDARRLILEVTESVPLSNLAFIARQMEEIKKSGVRFALDDVGCGYSALAYIRQLPLDQFKIDREFVSSIEHSEKDRVMVGAIIGMGKDIGMEVVAEGVENEAQFKILLGQRCDIFQGYLFDKPMPVRVWDERYPRDMPRKSM